MSPYSLFSAFARTRMESLYTSGFLISLFQNEVASRFSLTENSENLTISVCVELNSVEKKVLFTVYQAVISKYVEFI